MAQAREDIVDPMALLALCGELVIPDAKVTVCLDSEANMVIEAVIAGGSALSHIRPKVLLAKSGWR